ncbi:hypothetical protein IAI10_22140 [Clostridium sp. 19966]|uniref:DUF6442 family protein n=1 Tax=Clostridium sp. 19966 TaxID=2768166 RepID=UPI0028E01E00|nr:DUF6442 family protein [Clostridium sp. 19966]MDT8719359.1 hypothetical protein [Clostridium sp. 19966]
MNKEEILQKAQSKKTNTPDEMELQVVQKGSGIAVFSILVFCLILMIVKIIAKQTWYDVYSILFVSMGAQHFYKGINLHQRHEIICGMAFSVLAILMLVGYIGAIL